MMKISTSIGHAVSVVTSLISRVLSSGGFVVQVVVIVIVVVETVFVLSLLLSTTAHLRQCL